MKKNLFYIAILGMAISSCADSIDLQENQTNSSTELSTASTNQMQKVSEDGWFRSTRYFDGGAYEEYMNFTYNGLSAAFAHNVNGAANCPGGYQTINAHVPVENYMWNYMDVVCYKPVGGPQCLPYPKIRLNINKNTDDLVELHSKVYSTLPPITEGKGWPTGISTPTAADRQFNMAFDIYFQKNNPIWQTLANYCALMVWLNWEGNYGPAGEKVDEVVVDGVRYYVVARKDFANNDFIINYCRIDKATNIEKVNVLAIINHIKSKRYLGLELRNTKLTNYNLGFEIFNAKGAYSNQKFTINQYNTTVQ